MTRNNTTNFPPHLIEGFKKLADNFEAHIRADERERIASRVTAPSREALFPMTDMHGEPLQEVAPQPITPQQRAKLPRSLARTLHVMQSRRYPVTAATLARECKTTKGAILKRLSDLRRRGFVIERGRTTRFNIVNYKLASNQ